MRDGMYSNAVIARSCCCCCRMNDVAVCCRLKTRGSCADDLKTLVVVGWKLLSRVLMT